LPPSAWIEKRVSVLHDADGKGGTKERVSETWLLVIPNGLGAMFLRASNETAWPHLSVDVRAVKDDETPWLERGDVVEKHTLVDLGLATSEESEGGGFVAYEFVTR
jgi:hypothetical protein